MSLSIADDLSITDVYNKIAVEFVSYACSYLE